MKGMQVAIVGAGITGLSIADTLSEQGIRAAHERASSVGGLADRSR